MKHLTLALAFVLGAFAFATAASAETVACPATATAAACAENQAIHDAVTAHPDFGPSPVFVGSTSDVREYLGSDPDANVRLALRRGMPHGGTQDAGTGK